MGLHRDCNLLSLKMGILKSGVRVQNGRSLSEEAYRWSNIGRSFEWLLIGVERLEHCLACADLSQVTYVMKYAVILPLQCITYFTRACEVFVTQR